MAVPGTVLEPDVRRFDAHRIARWTRRATFAVVVVVASWFLLRFGTRWVAAGMNTVPTIPPGSWCVVDRWASGLRVGSYVFVETPHGEMLSRVAELREDAVVIAHPDPNCSWPDSAAFGPLMRDRVLGTVVVALPPDGAERGN